MIGTLSEGMFLKVAGLAAVARIGAPYFGWLPCKPLLAGGFIVGRTFLLLDMGGI